MHGIPLIVPWSCRPSFLAGRMESITISGVVSRWSSRGRTDLSTRFPADPGLRNAEEPNMTKPRPNILLLFTDQQRFDTIHALGNPIIQTPHIDRLVSMGTAFTSAYTCSPVCVSGR